MTLSVHELESFFDVTSEYICFVTVQRGRPIIIYCNDAFIRQFGDLNNFEFTNLLSLREDSNTIIESLCNLSLKQTKESIYLSFHCGREELEVDWVISTGASSEKLFLTGRLRSRFQIACDFCENAPVCLHKVRNDGIILWANHKELEFMGYANHVDEYIGHHINEFHEDQPALSSILTLLARKEVVCNHNARLRLRNGDIKHVIIQSNAVVKFGEFESTRCFTLDNTNKEIAERALQHNEEKFRNLVQNAPSIIFELDMEGSFLSVNVYGLRVMEMTNERQAIGRKFVEFVIEEYRESLNSLFHQALSSNSSHGEIVLKNCRTYYLTFISIMPEAGKLMGIAHDITDQKVAKEAAVEASIKKTEFMCKLSHEIRTPMNGIVGISQLLRDTELNGQQYELAQTILNCSLTIQNLLNDVLDISKIEDGKRMLSVRPTDLSVTLHNVMSLFQATMKSKGLSGNVQIDDGIIGRFYLIDDLSVTQIVTNLVNNAIKFTNNGFVNIRATNSYLSDTEHFIEISVIDSGIGIHDKEKEKIFEKFYQVPESSKDNSGTGLGLNICKQLAELLGGTIQCYSAPGLGSTFVVKFPSKLAVPSDLGSAVLRSFEEVLFERDLKRPRRSVEYRRALVAEDNRVNQKVAMAFLKKMNFQVDIAENGEEAVAMTTKHMYDVVLMDCQMPLCDGYQATQEIRKFNKEIPIIALTADVVAWSKQKCIDVGMTDFISKPMTKEKLYEVLCKWIEM